MKKLIRNDRYPDWTWLAYQNRNQRNVWQGRHDPILMSDCLHLPEVAIVVTETEPGRLLSTVKAIKIELDPNKPGRMRRLIDYNSQLYKGKPADCVAKANEMIANAQPKIIRLPSVGDVARGMTQAQIERITWEEFDAIVERPL